MNVKLFSIIRFILLLFIVLVWNCKEGSCREINTIRSILSEKEYDQLFPLRDRFYSYNAFLGAVKQMSAIKITIERQGQWIYRITRHDSNKGTSVVLREDADWDQPWAKKFHKSIKIVDYAKLCTNNSDEVNKRELAALFAHLSHETRKGENGNFKDGLMLTKELDTTASYVTINTIYPAIKGRKYYGRGPLQLSFNTNYGLASSCIFGDKNILLQDPDLITRDAVVAFETAIFFWMTPQGSKPSCHEVIANGWNPDEQDKAHNYSSGFGLTINIINGGLECNRGLEQKEMKDRVAFYKYYLSFFKIKDNNEKSTCEKMIPYPG